MSRSTLMSVARMVFWWTAAGLLLVLPWNFGGMTLFSYKWIVWSGWICAGCLAVWLWNCGRLHPRPTGGFWIALVCWTLLGLQVWLSSKNPSHLMESPFSSTYLVFNPVKHNSLLPSSAFWGASRASGELYLGLGVIALTAFSLGMERTAFRRLMMLFVANAAALAAVGIPFKYSSEKLILGKWEFSEWYFYSTFYYHNHWAAFVLLALGAAGALFVSRSGALSRGLLILAMALMGLSVVVAKTRLGVLAVILFAAAFAWFLARNRIFKSSRRIWGWMAGAGVLLLVGTYGISLWSKDKVEPGSVRQWEGLLQENPFTTRYLILLDTLPMIVAKPVFGWGLGGYGAAFQQYQRPGTITMHGKTPTRFEHPHNDWLERLAELGFLGFALLLAPGCVWLVRAHRRGMKSLTMQAVLIGCLVLLLFALGDMAFANRSVAAAFGLLFGLVVSKPMSVEAGVADGDSRQRKQKNRLAGPSRTKQSPVGN